MQPPESVVQGLRNIRETYELRWNPTAALAQAGHIDATGAVIQPKYEGRFELWDTDISGTHYMVMRVQTPEGGFLMPNDGKWLEFVRHLNPEHWGGDLHKMVAHFVDNPQELRSFVDDKDFDDLAERVAIDCFKGRRPSSRVLTNNCTALGVR